MDSEKLSKELFEICKSEIPSATVLSKDAIHHSIFNSMAATETKLSFSKAVIDLQLEAYRLYLDAESVAAGKAIRKVVRPLLGNRKSADDVFDFFEENFQTLDRFSLRLTQSRRSRAGTAFEVIVSELFNKLGYPYDAQPDISGSTPDYVLPNLDWYKKYPADSIILTLKRTLRERWRQIVTESSSGKYYLATIDENVSKPGLSQMMQRNITLVVPDDLKNKNYNDALNVISFETFFEDHLDPAMLRWKKSGTIE